MDIERAEELTRKAYKSTEYMWWRASVGDEHYTRPPLEEPVEDWNQFGEKYASHLLMVEEALGCTMATDDYTIGPHHTLTEGLARARYWLAQVTDAPLSLRRRVDECLRLVDEALAALDLNPDDPIVAAAR